MKHKRSSTDIHTLPHLATFRTELRSNLTPAEARLWSILKGSKVDGRKFRRQHSIGNYILDFYCASESIAIELDGAHHFSGAGVHYDRERRIFLEQFGVNVIRFENRMVFDDEEWVIAVIRSQFGWKERPVEERWSVKQPTSE